MKIWFSDIQDKRFLSIDCFWTWRRSWVSRVLTLSDKFVWANQSSAIFRLDQWETGRCQVVWLKMPGCDGMSWYTCPVCILSDHTRKYLFLVMIVASRYQVGDQLVSWVSLQSKLHFLGIEQDVGLSWSYANHHVISEKFQINLTVKLVGSSLAAFYI